MLRVDPRQRARLLDIARNRTVAGPVDIGMPVVSHQ
jgi:hypothetical protein